MPVAEPLGFVTRSVPAETEVLPENVFAAESETVPPPEIDSPLPEVPLETSPESESDVPGDRLMLRGLFKTSGAPIMWLPAATVIAAVAPGPASNVRLPVGLPGVIVTPDALLNVKKPMVGLLSSVTVSGAVGNNGPNIAVSPTTCGVVAAFQLLARFQLAFAALVFQVRGAAHFTDLNEVGV